MARVDYALDPSNPNTAYRTVQVQYDWDGSAIVGSDLGGTNCGGYSGLGSPITPGNYDPWGNVSWPGSPPPWPYYRWNAGRGYLWFSDLSLYYVHGRWYSPFVVGSRLRVRL